MNNETKTFYFEVQDIGSPEPSATFDVSLKHHGKTVKYHHEVHDLRKPAFDSELNAHKDKKLQSPAGAKEKKSTN